MDPFMQPAIECDLNIQKDTLIYRSALMIIFYITINRLKV